MLIFSGEPDRNPGVPGLACVFLHKSERPSTDKGAGEAFPDRKIRKVWILPHTESCVEQSSNTRLDLVDGESYWERAC
jgi:hypothetical protein